MLLNSKFKSIHNLNLFKKLFFLSFILLNVITIGHEVSDYNHQKLYQSDLMDSVTTKVLQEYLLQVGQDKLEINEFQLQNQAEFSQAFLKGVELGSPEYMVILNKLKDVNENIRLFSIITPEKQGLFKHITGDFLPDCKEEIHSTFEHGRQEELFLHRSKSSLHYDLLLPLVAAPDNFLFVAYNIDKIQQLLTKFSLPHQEIFLLRKDLKGTIELSNRSEAKDNIQPIQLKETELNTFSYLKPIPGTRWNIAIRLSDDFQRDLIIGSMQHVLTTLFVVLAILVFAYRMLSKSTLELVKATDFIRAKSKYDPLTGAYNKNTFSHYLDKQLTREKSHLVSVEKPLYLMAISINLINETDADTQDYYVKTFVSILMEFLGDEYVFCRSDLTLMIFSSKLDLDRVKKVDNEIREYLTLFNKQYSENILVSTQALEFSQQFRGVQYTKLLTSNVAIDETLEIMNSSSDKVKQLFEELELNKILEHALTSQQVYLFSQEIKCLATSDANTHIEVLVRLKDSEGNWVSPVKFIPLAERTGKIVPLDKLVIEKSIKKLAENQKYGSCSINLSGKTMSEPYLKEFIADTIAKHNVSPKSITFEVTETFAVENIEQASDFIQWIRDLGCHFALDDFGKGLSSFSYLQRLPVDKLKIDGCFIKDVVTNKKNQLFVKTMATLAHQLDMETVAEYVENEEILALLPDLNIDYAQGYGIDIPKEWV